MIVGVGIDLVHISHFQKKMEQGGVSFIKKVFSPEECAQAKSLSVSLKAKYFAKRFAAKEAFVKALGTGFGPVGIQDVWVEKTEAGQPNIMLSEKAQNYIKRKYKRPIHIHLSLSDDEDAIAIVVIEVV